MFLKWDVNAFPVPLFYKPDIASINITTDQNLVVLVFRQIVRFQNGCNKVVIELRVVQFWNHTCDFKSNSRCALVRFWNHAYDFRPNCTPLSSITIINRQNPWCRSHCCILSKFWINIYICVCHRDQESWLFSRQLNQRAHRERQWRIYPPPRSSTCRFATESNPLSKL